MRRTPRARKPGSARNGIPLPDPALQLLGLAARAGAVVPGTERVREGSTRGAVAFALVATDLTETGRAKLVPVLEAAGVPFVVRYTRDQLGAAVGRAPLAAVGLRRGAGFEDRLRVVLSESAATKE